MSRAFEQDARALGPVCYRRETGAMSADDENAPDDEGEAGPPAV